ncbi:MAG TPA: hypothetical protein VKK06_06105, partial [Terriglobia bacterium]|nr:hypothetical protein [Terriglobia bacterium]
GRLSESSCHCDSITPLRNTALIGSLIELACNVDEFVGIADHPNGRNLVASNREHIHQVQLAINMHDTG